MKFCTRELVFTFEWIYMFRRWMFQQIDPWRWRKSLRNYLGQGINCRVFKDNSWWQVKLKLFSDDLSKLQNSKRVKPHLHQRFIIWYFRRALLGVLVSRASDKISYAAYWDGYFILFRFCMPKMIEISDILYITQYTNCEGIKLTPISSTKFARGSDLVLFSDRNNRNHWGRRLKTKNPAQTFQSLLWCDCADVQPFKFLFKIWKPVRHAIRSLPGTPLQASCTISSQPCGWR